MPTEEEFKKLQREVLELQNLVKQRDFPLSVLFKSAIENAEFSKMNVGVARIQLPVYTTARDVTNNPPKHGELWFEDVAGPTRRICGYIVAQTTGLGTKYSVAIT